MKLVHYISIVALTFSVHTVQGQGMAINTSGSTADNSAMLDVSSTSKGILVPRMTAAQVAAISAPATGLLVYQTDGTAGFYYYNGSTWTIVGGGGGTPTGAAGGDLTGTYPNPVIASNAISTAEIQNGTIINADVSNSAAIAYSKLNLTGSVALTDLSATGTTSAATFLRGDNTWATPTASPSGAAGGSLTGTYPNPTLANGSVTIAKISASGSASSSTYLRGDGTWATPSGGGGSAGGFRTFSMTCGTSNSFTITSGTTDRFFFLDYNGCNPSPASSTPVSITLPPASSVSAGEVLSFATIRKGGTSNPPISLAVPSGTIYTANSTITSTITSFGNAQTFQFISNGTDWYIQR